MEQVRNSRRKYKKKKKNRKYFFFLFLFLIGIVIGALRLSKQYKTYDTIHPELTIYRDVVKANGYLLFNEDLVFANGSGVAVYNAQEGEKVPKNYSIANVNLQNDNSKIKDELILIQAAIDYKTNRSQKDEETLDKQKEVDNIVRNIQRFIRNESYDKLISSINSLDLSTNQPVNISELNELLRLSLENLERAKDKLSKELSITNSDYQSSMSGIVSYQIDDPKQIFSIKEGVLAFHPKQLTKDDIQMEEKGKNQVVDKEPFFRIIDNLDWYLFMQSTKPSLFELEEGSQVKVKFDDDSIVNGQIIKSDLQEGNVIVHFHDNLSDKYLKRNTNVTIIREQKDAYTIPSSALIENEDGLRGVYIEEIHGLVQFLPVSVIGETLEEVYIERGNFYGEISIKDKNYRTLSLHDSVIIEPNKVEEKQLVD
ncbi:hypothetical protein LQU94_02400 [Peptoniphilus sp. KCTC 25270]|uniref:HlyD family efflux transporter periplasmic adaptor subunit n=1 Tax=Peptoniphilus sp. KCTC 25270 TaxID=2897414 RepID=UPI001E55D432|nr:HlyD family efflux transporter periplasmic adaptor subunit [Peptoniphilus sp. KCTC 25270]MCD1146964.1 hypothetical protein [Peptoniphilus sp. KCTC 25270]